MHEFNLHCVIMSSLAFLVTELQSLASETRRRHPEIREAAEKSLAILRSSPEQATASLASDGPQAEDLLKPVFMGCATKNAKVVAISLGSLQRLISLKAVPQSAVPLIITTMNDAMTQGVDIQLRILQTLVSLIPNFPAIHGPLLGDALLLCFKLQESRIAVVSSTAAATLRQLVMFVVDKMVYEDNVLESEDKPPFPLTQIRLPNGSSKSLGPSSTDAYCVFEDLCLLANSEKPHFLKLESLHKTFALELVESVLTNYHDLFRKHEELILLLQHHLTPLLMKTMSDRPVFPLILRCTRVIFLLLKQFSGELTTEAEVFLMLLIRVITEDGSAEGVSESNYHNHVQGARPSWMRVISMEIMRGICSDAELMRNIWARYDSQSDGSKVFTSLLAALKRLLTEKPALLGVGTQMGGVGVQAEGGHHHDSVVGVAGRVASATVSGVAGIIGAGGHGLSLQGSSMKVQCIDQLDKADAPPIPEPYIYLLAVQCIVSLCEGLASFAAPIYSSIVIQRPRNAGDAPIRAPPALNVSSLPPSESQTKQLVVVQDIITNGWPAFLASLSFIISTNLSDELFVEVLESYQALTNVSGMLGLNTPRDAFLHSISKFAVPTRVVSSVETYSEPPVTPRSATIAVAEGLGLAGGPHQPPALSERNAACLKVVIGCSMFLAGSLGESWYGVLETLQNADYVLSFKAHGAGGKRVFSAVPPTTPGLASGRPISMNVSHSTGSSTAGAMRHPLLSDLDPDTLINAIQRLFDASKNLEDGAFKAFTEALCKLSKEMVGMQSDSGGLRMNPSMESLSTVTTEDGNNLKVDTTHAAHRRRMSGIHVPKNQRSGDFGIAKLGGVALSNIHRLIYRSPDIAWTAITEHLVHVIRLPYAPQSFRVQAAQVLDEILGVVPRHLSQSQSKSKAKKDVQAQVQRRVLEVLSQQIIPDPGNGYAGDTMTGVELRKMGLETLHQILQASGHTFIVGWEIVFRMLESVCKPFGPGPARSMSTDSLTVLGGPVAGSACSVRSTPSVRHKPLPLGLGNPTERSYSALVKIAFQSLTLVCDSVSQLSPEHLRLCISTLGHFGHQSDTNIALTSAASLLWSVSDAIQAKRKDVEQEPEYSELWLFLLLEVLGLCTDSRPEVRDGAIQSLFRAMQLYGSTLNADTWDQCIWKITFPLVDAITSEIRARASSEPHDNNAQQGIRSWDESKILALNSVGSILHDFLVSKIIMLDSFGDAWNAFVTRVQDCVLLDNRPVSAPALRCLEKTIKALGSAEGAVMKARISEALQRVWEAVDDMGSAVGKRGGNAEALEGTPGQSFTQESLVAYVDVVQSARSANGSLTGKEWDLERLTRLMVILKGVLTYPNSPDYRPDIDALPPLQTAVVSTIESIDLSVPGSSSLVMKDLSEYATLAFLAAFDVQPQPNSHTPQTPQKRVTYIGLSKKVMPMLVELFMRFRVSREIYADGTVEAVLSAYSIPIKLKYDCPSPSKFGKDDPLWKTATSSFLKIVKECTHQIKAFGEDLGDDRIEGLWWQILDVFRGGVLADCAPAESFPLEVQIAEENFDLSLIASLEIDVVPHLGDRRVPDALVLRLSKILQQGSRLYEADPDRTATSLRSRDSVTSSRRRSRSSDVTKVDEQDDYGIGKTDIRALVPRERFSYWCFDLLFLICSNTTNDNEESRKRLAALSLPSLLTRCSATLVSYIADQSLRGGLPFPRVREEELVYTLRKLLNLRLWPGSLWAAFCDEPTRHSSSQPTATELGLSTPSQLIADSVKRSSIGHLFHFHTSLCEIASVPGRTPSAWVARASGPVSGVAHKDETVAAERRNEEDVTEVDARDLARQCLREIGQELGVTH